MTLDLEEWLIRNSQDKTEFNAIRTANIQIEVMTLLPSTELAFVIWK